MFEDVNWNPDSAELRKFGRRLPAVLLLLGLYLWKAGAVEPGRPHHPFASYWWGAWGWTAHERQIVAIVLWSVAALTSLSAHLFRPVGLQIYRLFTAIGTTVGFVMGRIAMALVYFVIFTPVSILFKLIGRDPLKLKFSHGDKDTYWEPYTPVKDKERYKRMF